MTERKNKGAWAKRGKKFQNNDNKIKNDLKKLSAFLLHTSAKIQNRVFIFCFILQQKIKTQIGIFPKFVKNYSADKKRGCLRNVVATIVFELCFLDVSFVYCKKKPFAGNFELKRECFGLQNVVFLAK